MKTLSFIKQASFKNPHPQEDFFLISQKYPIFVVADGVSLNFDKDSDYPKKSGAGEVAKIFCEVVIREAEKKYDNFSEKNLEEIFDIGNKAVLEYNVSRGVTKSTINYWNADLFSATTAFLLIKDGDAYWWSLCDSGVLMFDKKGRKIFSSPAGWVTFERNKPENWDSMSEKQKIGTLHKDYRNGLGRKGEPMGYGVVDGEETARFYLNTGVLDAGTDNLIFVYTDGFENYFNLDQFIDIFKLWPSDLSTKLEDFISEKSKTDPKKYGSEKTLIAITN